VRYHSGMAESLKEGEFAPLLLKWFDKHGRTRLPWNMNRTLYRVWVSEVMLQQTQVATVTPYYERFMARFPDVQALSGAALDEVLHLWSGLGYYARARNLHRCARLIVERYGGEMPQEFDALYALPGIGRSTAGAILALSLDQRHPILDGNVKRVLSRIYGIAGDPGAAQTLKELWRKSDICTPTQRAGAYTQAIMDLGATICLRARPACPDCPIRAGCFAAREGRQEDYPGRRNRRARPERAAVLLLAEREHQGANAVLIERRPDSGIWGGLWSPPQFPSEDAALDWCRQEIGEPRRVALQPESIEHSFTHFDLHLKPLRVKVQARDRIREPDDRLWYQLDSPPRVGLPQPIRQLFARMLAP
jgi:A/G-specific adenine glycosylase